MLTHQLGWVTTVMPGSLPATNMLHKPAVQGLEQFRYSGVQYLALSRDRKVKQSRYIKVEFSRES